MTKKLLIILPILLIIAAGIFWILQPKSSPTEIAKFSTQTPIPTPVVANFYRNGVILNWDSASQSTQSDWTFLYEEADKPALTVKLIFDQNSLCIFDEGEQPCSQTQMESGDSAKLEAFNQDQTATVIKLEKVIPQ